MFRIFKEAKDAFLYTPPGTPSPVSRPPYSPRGSQSPAAASTSGTGAHGVPSELRSGDAAARLKDALGTARVEPTPEAAVEVEKNDELDTVVSHLGRLVQAPKDEYMRIIMALSELQTALASSANVSYFILRAKGLNLMLEVLGALAYPQPPPAEAEDAQLLETQRVEGIRLWFSVLDCIVTDSLGAQRFQDNGGYSALEEPLRAAANPSAPTILGHLLSHILASDYTALQTLLAADTAAYPAELSNLSSDLVIRHPNAVPLVFTLIDSPDLRDTVYRILLQAGPTLFGLQDLVPELLDLGQPLHFALLKRVLESGIKPRHAHLLFRRAVRNVEPPTLATTPEPELEAPVPDLEPKKNQRPQLKLDLSPLAISPSSTPTPFSVVTPEPESVHDEILDPDVVDLIRHAMRFRSPSAHAFRPGKGGSLKLKDAGKPWPIALRGYQFYAWVHITQLHTPLTLFRVFDADDKTVLRIRILENSLIGIVSTSPTMTTDAELIAETEIVCQSLDALIPHNQWIHLGISGRRPKGAPSAEMRIVLNGQRVAHMRVPYPAHEGPVGIEISEGGQGNEWMLGPAMALCEASGDDMALLLHHLGPRYAGNMQDSLGRFLTYDGATSLNIYLSSLAKGTADKPQTLLPTNTHLVKSLRHGQALHEDALIIATPSALTVHGDVQVVDPCSLDEAMAVVGGPAVALRLIELARTESELTSTMAILAHLVKESWSACEELERIRGYDILASILRPKIPSLMTTHTLKLVLSLLGINMDKPDHAVVHNTAAYRALALDFELWSKASEDVVTMYLQHFHHLLTTSKFARFNTLRSFQKLGVVRKLLFALKSQWFRQAALPDVIDVLKVLLVQRWSSEDAIKPVFSYLVSSLCQGTTLPTFAQMAPPAFNPTAAQYAPSLVFAMIADVIKTPARLIKTNKVLSLHRLLVIFLTNNPALFTIEPCLAILESCLPTTIGDSFLRHFEAEGGFALLARVLPLVWTPSIQSAVFRLLMGPQPEQATSLRCAPILSCLIATIERLLQAATDAEDSSSRPPSRPRSSTATSAVSQNRPNYVVESPASISSGLVSLLEQFHDSYKLSLPFRRNMTSRRIEVLLPAFTEFATLSGPSSKVEATAAQRATAASLLSTLSADPKLPPNLVSQLRAVIEQLRWSGAASPKAPSTSLAFSPASPMNFSSSQYGTSIGSRFAPSSPSAFNPSSPGRRRPAAEMGMGRSRSIVERRTPLKRVLTGELSLQDGKDKNTAWKMIILSVEATRFSKLTLERKEQRRRVQAVDWPKQLALLKSEGGLWPDDSPAKWRLDGSEGPLRMRVRLERVGKAVDFIPQRPLGRQRDAIPQHDELSSAVSRVNASPWEDPFALALGEAAESAENGGPGGPAIVSAAPELPTVAEDAEADAQSISWADEETSDKQRRIAKTLQAGDVVEEAHNIVRIVGVDALPGLLIFGKRNLYMVDGLVQAADGEIIDARDAPHDVLSIPSGTLAEIDSSDQQSHRWQYTEIVESNKRAFLFRDVALELYFADKRNFLIVLRDKKERQGIVQKLMSKNDHRDAISRSIIGNFVLDTVAKAVDKSAEQLDNMTRRWQTREISTFAYLQILNQHANRTPNDVTQYPVFPWVLADYNSDHLDFTNPATYRTLSLPMGAQTVERREAAQERYAQTEMIGESPFHYGTHYSSSMIVCGFLIRQSPFTEIFLALQGGNFDLADRLFSSVGRAWESASRDNRGDVRELIPEFFYNPNFLVNMNKHDFGTKQGSGDKVDDVQLPPWAMGDPLLFIHRHREALESDYVSRHLPTWIDTVFGYKQRDPASFTCFHPLSYRGAVDLEHIEDEAERAASTAIIHNFGQTPVQIFKTAHPNRFYNGRTSLPVGVKYGIAEHWPVMMRSIVPITEYHLPISIISEAPGTDLKPSVHPPNRIPVPGHMHLSLQIGLADKSMRVYATDARPRLIYIAEGTAVSKALFAGGNLLITADTAGVLMAWRYTIHSSGFTRGDIKMTLESRLRGHVDQVNCLASSLAWSIFVSGSQDGTAIVWDMNALRYIRTLRMDCGEPVEYCAIHNASGHILLASKSHLQMFTLNGARIASSPVTHQEASSSSFAFATAPPAASVPAQITGGPAFLEREFLKEGPIFALGIGPDVALWRCAPGIVGSNKPWSLREIGKLGRRGEGDGVGICTAVKFIGETMYAAFKSIAGASTANRKGCLHQWTLPEGPVRNVPDHLAPRCMSEGCSRHFGLLEPRRHCGGCGGSFCSADAQHCEGFEKRYCVPCRLQLAQGLVGSRRTSLERGLDSRRGSLVG